MGQRKHISYVQDVSSLAPAQEWSLVADSRGDKPRRVGFTLFKQGGIYLSFFH